METAFLICLSVVLYTYAGYAALLYVVAMVKRLTGQKKINREPLTPSLTVIVAAYNEEVCIEEKILNCLSLDYAQDKLHFIFVTDGSNDNTPSIAGRYPQIQLLHQPERKGKISAVQRAMEHVQTELVVFTDANTMLNKDALLKLSHHFADKRIGAVAGEKRVFSLSVAGAAAMEGWYWKYESNLKKWEAELYSVMGAAGELFCLRSDLYRQVPADTLLDDFMISLNVLRLGYRIQYEPGAFATEKASQNIHDEWRRKIRIAAGGIQMLQRSGGLFSSGRTVLIFEYISHRVLRWLVAPWLLIALLVLHIGWVLAGMGGNGLMLFLVWAQSAWYIIAILGWLLQKTGRQAGVWYVPFYFCMMNAAIIAGTIRFVFQKQTVFWEKAARGQIQE